MLPVIALLLLIITTVGLLRVRSAVRHTSLKVAWWWAVLSLAVHAAAVQLPLAGNLLSVSRQMAAHYIAATVMLAPLVSVLGSRRPGTAAWPWFVVTPMIVVLCWPVMNELIWTAAEREIDPGTPALTGSLLVLIMSAGNYLGTRNSLPALLYSAAVLCHLSPAAGWIADPATAALVAALSSSLVVVTAWPWKAKDSDTEADDRTAAANRMWCTFRDLFGLVWARRVADRVNQFAHRENWIVRLTLTGFAAVDQTDRSGRDGDAEAVAGQSATATNAEPSDADIRRPLDVLCWVLRRFADPEWMHAQLGPYFSAERHGGSLVSEPTDSQNLPVSGG